MGKTALGTVGFLSLGCAKNLIDSETMLGRVAEEGFVITGNHQQADVVVVNTCGFLESARQESLTTIRGLIERKAEGQLKRVVVAGCMVGEYQERLLQEVPQVDAMVSVNDREKLVEVLRELRGSGELGQHLRMSDPDRQGTVYDDRGRFRLTPRHYAYLRIAEGCDHTCSFCIIPTIRGRFRSKPMELILEEARELVADGARELILVAQDTTYYGIDIEGKSLLAKLMKRLAREVDGLEWIRLMYAYPHQVTPELIEVMAEEEKILPYLDMPLQHVNQRLLKDMRRGGSQKLIEQQVEAFRAAMPDFCLRTTFIVGFPGEEEHEFEELLAWVQAGWAQRVGCFVYSPEPGSRAVELKNQEVEEAIALKRQERLMQAAQSVLFERNQKQLEQEVRVIIDGDSQDPQYPFLARTYADCPEIDCEVLVKSNRSLKAGDFMNVRIKASLGYDLLAESIEA